MVVYFTDSRAIKEGVASEHGKEAIEVQESERQVFLTSIPFQ